MCWCLSIIELKGILETITRFWLDRVMYVQLPPGAQPIS